MAVISSTSSKEKTVLEPCYRSRPLLPLSAHGFASSTSSSFSVPSSQFLTRHPVPGNSISTSVSSSVRFAVDLPSTPSRSMTVKKPFADNGKNQSNGQKSGTPVAGTKKACLCSPSTHPGSFRCAMHRNAPRGGASQSNSSSQTASSYNSNIRLNYRRSAMNNSLVRIGGVEGDLVKRALAALIRPTAHNQRRRADFQPKPSRLSVMSKTASDS
ncbi:hypothetical protein RchiOBHm_Chr2g0134271 [Rosa chinensis]|uniref:Serine-rich protein-like protein n=1 Tax=Rosa chinensis TaxID=74649 RepID=A0A2P6RVS9_ROSCH|nr:uncharacterized protein LOC112185500 [Rosa chinensis]PRQ50531.1 hypothetical protein RchiOBHm_Chr2g0134271 [Rosa chinensis]